MRIADTSALYALFSEGDVHHAEARLTLQDPEPVLVPHEILAETVALVHHRVGFDAAVAAGAFLRGLPHVEVATTVQRTAAAAWGVFEAASGHLSYPDAVVVAWCRDVGATPLAFDADLLERA